MKIAELAWGGGVAAALGFVAFSVATIPTTLNDYFQPGTQPGEINETLIDALTCSFCHGNYEEPHEIYKPWAASMMGQSARDPVFWAALAVANQDASFSGEFCLRCHVPVGWYSGRSTPPDGSALENWDFDGVSCITCHRMVDPVYRPGESPAVDADILAGLAHPPVSPGNTQAVIDPQDRRRGPIVVTAEFHRWEQSPFHQRSAMCGTCHEVSNPVFRRSPSGNYVLTPLDQQHPTMDKRDMFPLDRTYSEWTQSDFARGPINLGGRFGGNKLEVSSCQDCHMPDSTGYGANPLLGAPEKSTLPRHFFNGGNTWVLRAVRNLYPDAETGLTRESVDESIQRAVGMLQAASDLELSRLNRDLNVRIVNQSGHKLPTGYHEGRRMWINVKFRDAQGQLIGERGAYDPDSAVLSVDDTKVYENKQGLDAAMAALTGKPEGETFHHVLNNVVLKDNRIPPRGFTNANFNAVQADVVGYAYADGQFWDDTRFTPPVGTRSAEVAIYYQTTSKEYIEFLRDTNTTNNAGRVAYEQWVQFGKSAPALMDAGTLAICTADFNADGQSDFFDYLDFVQAFAAEEPAADANNDGQVDFFDYLDFAQDYAEGC
ncbi:MAG: multiheme c-type cytochrome [Planctomycetota bacterium]|nr:multiheme c-type cytochrome [Planctomycetota bacterium]